MIILEHTNVAVHAYRAKTLEPFTIVQEKLQALKRGEEA